MLLNEMYFFCICRHTGSIECANSLSLTYTPKQVPFGLVSNTFWDITFFIHTIFRT